MGRVVEYPVLAYHSGVIDSHCHLTAKEFAADRAEAIARARAAGVDRMIVVADTMEEGLASVALAQQHDGLFATIGVHPNRSKSWSASDAEKIREIVRSPNKIVAIGEIGLDYHYEFSDHETQKNVFREQLLLAKELNMPVVIHCREAVSDVWAIVNEVNPPPVVLHCCSEKVEDVEPFLRRGDMLSFTGIITFPSADEIRRTIKATPIEQIMIETDAPYLAPIPYRGKRNEPAFVAEVVKVIAAVKGISLEEVDRITTENAVRFFRLPQS